MLLSVIMLLSVVRVNSSAVKVNITENELKYFVSVKDLRCEAHPTVKLFLNNKYISERAYLINDTTYIPLRATAEIAGATVKYDARTRSATVSMKGLVMQVSDGSYVIEANGRAIVSKSPAVILADGRMYVPVRSIAKALSLGVSWSSDRTVSLKGEVKPIARAEEFYDADTLYWLSRIISAESRGEPLLGQIAVGEVVLNRVKSKDFPSTVWGVIFDRKHGVQFSPVENGSIYKEPSYNSVIAAKLCLEGFSLDKNVLFFMEPSKSTSSWIPTNRKYAFTVANHYFFY